MGPNHELWLSEHPTGADLIGTYPALNQSNSAPRARYMNNMGPRPDDLPQPIPVRCRFLLYLGALLLTVGYPKVHIKYPRDQSHHGSQPTQTTSTGATQMIPGPPRNGYNALVAPVCAPPFFRYI
jgi:hypothetical protein